MTSFHPDASAKAPCTKTTVGLSCPLRAGSATVLGVVESAPGVDALA
jgi:hypothetical protein